MTEWERTHGKIIKVTELDSTGKIKIITDKGKISIWLNKAKQWYRYLDLSILPIILIDIVAYIGYGIIAVALGLILATQIMQSIEYLMNY